VRLKEAISSGFTLSFAKPYWDTVFVIFFAQACLRQRLGD
jgi:hypothetical protein